MTYVRRCYVLRLLVHAIVEFDGNDYRTRYVRRSFRRELDFGMTSVNYDFTDVLARAGAPA